MSETGEWSLSPAYDLSFSPGLGGEHTMTILGEGRAPTREHILALAAQFDIKPAEGSRIIDEVNAGIAKWKKLADEAELSKKTIRAISAHHQSL